METNIQFQAKPTHQNIIRLSPPLVISEEQIADALRILKEAIIEVPAATAAKSGKD
jgi:ornithine--oxo-acid transaminase